MACKNGYFFLAMMPFCLPFTHKKCFNILILVQTILKTLGRFMNWICAFRRDLADKIKVFLFCKLNPFLTRHLLTVGAMPPFASILLCFLSVPIPKCNKNYKQSHSGSKNGQKNHLHYFKTLSKKLNFLASL